MTANYNTVGKCLADGLCLYRETAKELWELLYNLEEIKFDHCEKLKRQRYEVSEERRRQLQLLRSKKKHDSNTIFYFFQVVSLRNRIDELQKQ